MTPEERKKKLEEIREAARAGRVRFAPQDKVEETEPYYVRHVLEVIGEAFGNPKIANAWVSDQSSVGDFFICRNRPMQPPCDDVCVCDFSEEESRISEALGVPVTAHDYVVEVARRYGGVE